LRSVTRNDSVPTSADFVWDEVQSRNKLLIAPPAWAGNSYIAWAQSVMSTLAEALSAAVLREHARHCDVRSPLQERPVFDVVQTRRLMLPLMLV
ncbi:MAG: hypothetical protein ACKVHE_36970, partial [Planctomycetales bacterium]